MYMFCVNYDRDRLTFRTTMQFCDEKISKGVFNTCTGFDDDFVGFRSLRALGIYDIDH